MRRVITVVECDIDGSPNAETHTVGVDGVHVEVDLCDASYRKLIEAATPYIGAAQRVNGAGRPKPGSTTRPRAGYTRIHIDASPGTVRAWWAGNPAGLPPFKPYGPLPEKVKDAFRRATAGAAT